MGLRIDAPVLLAALLVGAGGCPSDDDDVTTADDDATDDDTTGDDDDSTGDDDSAGDDDTGGHELLESPLGLSFGFNEWGGQDYASHLEELGLRRIHVTVWWGDFEPEPDEYQYALVDDFVAQLAPDTLGAIRITARGNPWGMTEESGYTVPADLSVGGDYYDFVREVVARAAGRVALFQNDWEVDAAINWAGTPAEYAEMTRTFHAAVRDVDSQATLVLGGSYAEHGPEGEAFFDAVFADLQADGQPRPFDLFDLHLYQPARDYPSLIGDMRATLDAHPETAGVPIVALEYGGPTPPEFRSEHPELYDQLIGELQGDITLLGGDLASTPLQPGGYPDELRMFAYGLDAEPGLDDRRDRIQARGMAQRTLVALAEGVSAVYWWELMAQQVELSVDLGVYFRHFTYGKLNLTLPDPDPGGSTLVPRPTYDTHRRVVGWLQGVRSVERLDAGDDDLWLCRITDGEGESSRVVWHDRDPFDGEDEPPIEASFAVPVSDLVAEDVFGEEHPVGVDGGFATLLVSDTPIRLSPPR